MYTKKRSSIFVEDPETIILKACKLVTLPESIMRSRLPYVEVSAEICVHKGTGDLKLMVNISGIDSVSIFAKAMFSSFNI